MKAVFDTNILVSALVFPAGRADLIVTGDGALLELREYRGVQIVSLRKYLSR